MAVSNDEIRGYREYIAITLLVITGLSVLGFIGASVLSDMSTDTHGKPAKELYDLATYILNSALFIAIVDLVWGIYGAKYSKGTNSKYFTALMISGSVLLPLVLIMHI